MCVCVIQVTTKSLQTLNLGHNNITNEGVFRLKDGMLRNKSLLRIGMQAVKMSCEGETSSHLPVDEIHH